MFTAKFKETNTFRKLIESIKEIVKLVNIDVTQEGMCIQAMDSSHVALVSVSLENGNEAFEDYRCDKPTTLGLSIEDLSKILKCAGNEDFMKLECECDSTSQLGFTFSSRSGDKSSEFSLNLKNIDSDDLGVPDQAYTANAEFSSTEFSRICKEFGTIGESIKFECAKDSIRFSVTGALGTGSTILKASESAEGVALDVSEPVTLSFAARYLNQFSKASGFVEKVTLRMAADNPLLIEYKLPKKLGYLKFYLAPKIPEENE